MLASRHAVDDLLHGQGVELLIAHGVRRQALTVDVKLADLVTALVVLKQPLSEALAEIERLRAHRGDVLLGFHFSVGNIPSLLQLPILQTHLLLELLGADARLPYIGSNLELLHGLLAVTSTQLDHEVECAILELLALLLVSASTGHRSGSGFTDSLQEERRLRRGHVEPDLGQRLPHVGLALLLVVLRRRQLLGAVTQRCFRLLVLGGLGEALVHDLHDIFEGRQPPASRSGIALRYSGGRAAKPSYIATGLRRESALTRLIRFIRTRTHVVGHQATFIAVRLAQGQRIVPTHAVVLLGRFRSCGGNTITRLTRGIWTNLHRVLRTRRAG